jgi:S-DNA-T family DNA segregation ATPase FtsK/SpoIIIE
MPHLLIAGATGSGKSVCVNTLITSILYRATPDEVKLLMIDPKVVELSAYNGIPHLLIPVVTDPKKAAGALNWAVQEMGDRYKLFAAANVRDLKGYNLAVEELNEGKKLPQIVIIVDELADLMMVAPNDVEDAICRLAQMARAAGLHLVIATQRPSVDVITGLIKANIPSRIAFNVSSGIDSRTIIDSNGAEKLLGKGDMLFYPVGLQKPVRVQGAFISDKEVENIVTYLKDQAKVVYNEKIMTQLSKSNEPSQGSEVGSDYDAYFNEALELVIDKQKASASMIQRRFRVGYNRAARIVDQLFEAGFVGDEEGSKPRTVLMTREAYSRMKEENNLDETSESSKSPTNDGLT